MSASGQVRWYDSGDQWPKHAKPWFRAALAKARAAGWQLKGAGGASHIFGTLYCRPASDGPGCKFVVFSSGAAGESAATELVRMVDRCIHLSSTAQSTLTQVLAKLALVETLLGAAEKLLNAARDKHEADDAWAKAGDFLDVIEASALEVVHLMDCAEEAEEAARVAIADAQDALRPFDLLALDLDAERPADLLDHAERTSTDLRAEVKELPPASVAVAEVKTRLGAAKTYLAELRERLTNM